LHFTPTSSSWLNLIERWFKELNDKRLRRGVFTSVADLTPGDHRVGRTLEDRPEAVRMESHGGTDHHQSPTRTSKSDADVKPSTGLKLRRTTTT
jgi:hypothetical protein